MVLQHFDEEPIKVCPECDGSVHRLIGPVGVVFKGKGFYSTDNKSDSASD
jgi:predicted nucleic acid-binding Zn ribbon protein